MFLFEGEALKNGRNLRCFMENRQGLYMYV